MSTNATLEAPGRVEARPEAAVTHETYAAASDYLISGYAVVPLHGVEGGHCTCRRGSDCSCAGKHPIRRDWAHQPIRTQEDLHSFWKGRLERPTNIGILLDSPQRLLLIDVDTKNAKLGENTIRDWSADIQIDLATYRLQDTPSGGWHCLFRVPETYERTLPNRAEVGPGVDVLCRDKQFVVSPSQTDKGRYSTLSANVRETRSAQRIRVGRRQRKRTCWDCEREWKRMVVPLEPGRPSEARQLLRTRR